MENRNQNMTEQRKYMKYLCGHNKQKYHCRECKGSQICSHDRRKSQCRECKGSQICPHKRQKQTCKDCKGSQICQHNKQKAHCKACKGSQICQHNKQKSHCKKCSDPIKVNIEQWIFHSRQYDKMNNIYDADRFIDRCFLKGLIEDTNNVITEIAKSTSNIQNIKMILRQSRDLIIRLVISRATVFCAA